MGGSNSDGSQWKGLCGSGRFFAHTNRKRPGPRGGGVAISRPRHRSLLHSGKESNQPTGAIDSSSKEDRRRCAAVPACVRCYTLIPTSHAKVSRADSVGFVLRDKYPVDQRREARVVAQVV